MIAGMEWAAKAKARVANMSIGSYPTDGTDPVSQAVNQLSARYGTLFVVAAGNSGDFVEGVDSPGAATAALTVGAVDFDDQLAFFSSRGPRVGDYAIKPDVTAPGVDIVQARAAGTSLGEPVDQWYTRLSGTSMATPHVAGAAAILAQQHPTWPSTRLKAVLMGTADPHPDLSVYQQGGGRLDVAHAVAQTLVARRVNLDYGYFRYPQTGTGPATKPLTYTNYGSAAVTVDLGLTVENERGQRAPARMVTISPSRLTVPAGGSATTEVTVGVRRGPPGFWSGQLVATPSAGPAVHTPLGFYKEPERYDLTVTGIRRDGTPDTDSFDSVGIMNVDNGELFNDFRFFDQDGRLTVRVAPGHYLVMGYVTGVDVGSVSLVGDPEVTVRRDTAVTLDARRALPLTARVRGRPAKPDKVSFGYTRYDQTGKYGNAAGYEVSGELARGGVFAQPTEPVRRGKFEFETQWRLIQPSASSAGSSRLLWELMFYGPAIPDPPAYVVAAVDMPKLARITSRYYAANDTAQYFEGRIGLTPLMFFGGTGLDPLTVPLTRVEYLTPEPILWDHFVGRFDQGAELDLYDFGIVYPVGARRQESWFEAPFRPDPFGIRDEKNLLVGVSDFEDAGRHFGDFFEWDQPPVAKGATRLYRDDTLLASGPEPFLFVPVSPAAARYRLERDLDVDGLLELANRSRTSWWFTSAGPTGGVGYLPLLEVDNQVRALDGRDGLPAGRAATVDLDVHRQEGAARSRVVATHLWFSTDDGATWTAAGLRRMGAGRYRAVLPATRLPSGKYVSLRTWARDAGGSRIQQVLVRAVPIR